MIVQILLAITFAFVTIYGLKLIHNGFLFGVFIETAALVCLALVIFPEYAGFLANILGVGRGADLLLYLSFVMGVFLVFHVSIKIHRQNLLITKIIRHCALKDVEVK